MKKLTTLCFLLFLSLMGQAAVSSITSGKYYRLTNAQYTNLSMVESGEKVSSATTDTKSYAQMWIITKNGTYYTLRNALTGNYIQGHPGVSTQWSTGTTAHNFNVSTSTNDNTTVFAFNDPTATYYANYAYLHCAATQSYNVVGWLNDGLPSRWILEEITLSESELEEITNIRNALSNASSYTSKLANYFSDYACTTLKSSYATMTDDALRSAMSSLPTALQDMAIRVKNDTWNSSKGDTWNSYEKDFRIHSYDIFSNSDLWDDITGTGPFAHLFHPTGIQASTGEIVYLFVSSNVTNSDASLEAECVAGTDRKGAAYALTRGYNAIYVPYDCEIFVSYLLNNTNKSCNSYPNITVHIEGGTCNGCFDMRGHGHTNDDWAWLKNNMFKNTYLHVKGNSTMLNCLRERVVDTSTQDVEGIMNIFDFIFDTEQSLAGCDQWKTSGRYKMMVNNYDNEAGGNPFWSNGGYGYSQPGIYKDGIFNYSNLRNVSTGGGQIWVIMHELGHGHQGPINISGQTESSNNSLAQCVNFLTTNSARGKELFTTTRSSRSPGVAKMIENFNKDGGYSWIDYAGYRTDKSTGGDSDIWTSNFLYFQLWMYFDYLGNYQPTGGNTGFSFINALYDKLRANGITKQYSSSSPALATQDYLLVAKYAAEITQTDLSEFFEVWGFWKTKPTIARDNDVPANMIWEFPDYYTSYIQTSQSQVDEVRNYMKSLPNKAGGLMFIEDRCTGSKLPTYNGATVSSFGETGYYETYDQPITGTYKASFSGNNVTVSDGSGAVGFKIYDGDGNLVALKNTTSFTLSSTITTGLKEGDYRLRASQGDGQDVEVLTQDYSTKAYEDFYPYFYQNVGQYFGITQACYDQWFDTFQKRMITCTATEYKELETAVQNGIRYPTTGKYRIKSSGTRNIGESYIGYGSPKTSNKSDGLITVAAANAKADKTTVITLTESGVTGSYYMSTNGLNVQNQTTNNQPFPATNETGVAFTFEILSPGVVAISHDLTEQGYFHEANDAQGWTIPGVVRWIANETPSHWTVEDAYDPGDVNEDNSISIADVTALVNIILGKDNGPNPVYNHQTADVNKDGHITIADVTALVNIILGKD